MANEPANPGDQGNPQAGAQPGNDGGVMIPKSRFDEVNERMKAAEAKVAENARAEEARNRAALEAAGKWDELKGQYETELAVLRPKAEQFDSFLSARRETLLAGLKDEDKPLADGLPLDKLEALVARLGAPAAPAAPVVPVVAGNPGPSAQTGMATPQEIAANAGKPGWIAANWHRLPR